MERLTLISFFSANRIWHTIILSDRNSDAYSSDPPQTINITVNEQADAPTLTASAATPTIDEGGSVEIGRASCRARMDEWVRSVMISGVRMVCVSLMTKVRQYDHIHYNTQMPLVMK